HQQTLIVTLGPAGARAATADWRFISVPALKVTPMERRQRLAAATAILALATVLAAGSSATAKTKSRPGYTHGIANSALIAAAKRATLKSIDYLDTYCDGATTVEAWLTALTAGQVRAIRWSGGPCELINNLNPLDAGGSYCAQATILLNHVRRKADNPMIEIYFEEPKHGRLGESYAFRGVMITKDGPDYVRRRKEFESEWYDRFPRKDPPACTDDDDG
ncbi:MAG: hypothetical protein ACHP7N_17495, partial [Caulobacterales bacterium]